MEDVWNEIEDTGKRGLLGRVSASPPYAQGCVGKLAALLHAPRARVGEDGSSLLD